MIRIDGKTITTGEKSVVYLFGTGPQKGITRRIVFDAPPYTKIADAPDGIYEITQQTLKGEQIGPRLTGVKLAAAVPQFTKGLNVTGYGLMKWPLFKQIKTNAGDVTVKEWLTAGNFREFRFWLSHQFRPLAAPPFALFSKVREYLDAMPGSVATICLATEGWTGAPKPTAQEAEAAAVQLVKMLQVAALPLDRIKIEIGNEPEPAGGRYFPWNFGEFAPIFNAMAEIVTTSGIYVIGPACTGDAIGSKTTDLYRRLDPRYFKAIGIHLYRQSVSGIHAILGNLSPLLPDKDWNFTEARVYWGGNYLSSIDEKRTIRNSRGEDKHKDPPKTAEEVNTEDATEFAAVKSYADRRRIVYSCFADFQQFETSTGPIGLIAQQQDKTLIETVFGECWKGLK